MNQETRQKTSQETRLETNKPEDSKKPERDTALRDHIKARITRKPNRIICVTNICIPLHNILGNR